MSKIASVLKDEIARVARKEAKALVDPLKKQLSAQRGLIGDLRQQLAERTKHLKVVVSEMARGPNGGGASARRTGPVGGYSTADIVSLRKRLKLTREGMAKRLKVSPQTIYNWERGTSPKEKYWPRIAKLQATGETLVGELAGTGKSAKAAGKAKKARKAAAKRVAGKTSAVKKAAAKTAPAKQAPIKGPAKKNALKTAAKKVSRRKSAPGLAAVPAAT